MIANPVVYGSGGSAWKEVDRSYVAEHANDSNANVLVAVFTPDFPDQPMIIPASYIFGIGDGASYKISACTYKGAYQEAAGRKIYYVLSFGEGVAIYSNQFGTKTILSLSLAAEDTSRDIIPEGWTIKYFIYEA